MVHNTRTNRYAMPQTWNVRCPPRCTNFERLQEKNKGITTLMEYNYFPSLLTRKISPAGISHISRYY